MMGSAQFSLFSMPPWKGDDSHRHEHMHRMLKPDVRGGGRSRETLSLRGTDGGVIVSTRATGLQEAVLRLCDLRGRLVWSAHRMVGSGSTIVAFDNGLGRGDHVTAMQCSGWGAQAMALLR